jgi:hypothetical protein
VYYEYCTVEVSILQNKDDSDGLISEISKAASQSVLTVAGAGTGAGAGAGAGARAGAVGATRRKKRKERGERVGACH